jgi:hypothetical protein
MGNFLVDGGVAETNSAIAARRARGCRSFSLLQFRAVFCDLPKSESIHGAAKWRLPCSAWAPGWIARQFRLAYKINSLFLRMI